jgi:hypothetical protein
MGSKGGSPPPAPASTQVVRSEIPEFFRPFLEDIFRRSSAISEEAYIPPPERGRLQEVGEETLAPIDPAQQAALDRLKSTEMAETGVSAVRAGQGLTLSGGERIGGEQIREAMNPFQQAVTDIAVREELRRAAPQRQALQAQAARAGAFGGSRGALLEAEFERNLGQRLADIQTTGGAAAFDRATQRLEQERQRQIGAGQALAGLGAQEASVLSAGVGRQLSAGEAQRGLQTEAIGRGLEEFQREVDYPKQQIGFYSGILRGYQPPMNTYQTVSTPFSPTQQILGQAAAAGAIGKGFGLFNDGGIVGLAFGGAPSQQYTESVGDDKGLSSMVGNPVASYANGGVGRTVVVGEDGKVISDFERTYGDTRYGTNAVRLPSNITENIREKINIGKEYLTAPSVSFSPEADPLSEMESYADYGLPKINIPLSDPKASLEERVALEKRVKGVVNQRVEDLLRVSAEQGRPLTIKQAQAQALEDVYGGERLGSEMAASAGKTGNQLIATGQVLAQESNRARKELEAENKAARAEKVTELAKKLEEKGFDPGSAIQAAQAEVSTDTTPTRKQIAERIGTGQSGVAPTRGTGTGSKPTAEEEGPLLADDEVVGGPGRLPVEEAKSTAAAPAAAEGEPQEGQRDLTDWFGLAAAALAASTGREEGLTNAAKLLASTQRPEERLLNLTKAQYYGEAGKSDRLKAILKRQTDVERLKLDYQKFTADILEKDRRFNLDSFKAYPDLYKQVLSIEPKAIAVLGDEDSTAEQKEEARRTIISSLKRAQSGLASGGSVPQEFAQYGVTGIRSI